MVLTLSEAVGVLDAVLGICTEGQRYRLEIERFGFIVTLLLRDTSTVDYCAAISHAATVEEGLVAMAEEITKQ